MNHQVGDDNSRNEAHSPEEGEWRSDDFGVEEPRNVEHVLCSCYG